MPRKRRSEVSPNKTPIPSQQHDSKVIELKPPVPRRSSTFPENQGVVANSKRASFPSGLPNLQPSGQQWPPGFNSRRPVYHDIYDALTALTPGDVTTPGSAPTSGFTFSTPPQSQTQTMTDPSSPVSPSFPQDSSGPNPPFPDLTSMMFPSGDPFAYPNQPTAAFESQFSGQGNFGPNNLFPSFATLKSEAPSDSTPNDGNLFIPPSSSLEPNGNDASGDADVQLFGPMPMYMMQGQQSQQHQPNFGIQGPQHNQQSQQQGQQQQPQKIENHQQGQQNVNLEELFSGEEWANIFGEHDGGFGDLGNSIGVSSGFHGS